MSNRAEYIKLLSCYPEINSELVDTLQGKVNLFVKQIGSSEESSLIFRGLVRDITELIYGQSVEEKAIETVSEAIDIIRRLSIIQTNLWESDGKTQKRVTSSLSTLLLKTLDENFHTVRVKCNKFDSKTSKCLNNNDLVPLNDGSGGFTDEHIIDCDFHKYDSLSVHLVLACVTNTLWAFYTDCDNHVIMKAGLMGLYHDIGKMKCVEAYEFKKSMMTGFPAHAEIGSMLFQVHYSAKMNEFITDDEFMCVSCAILRHMCGYHRDENESNSYKRFLLLLDQPTIRYFLTINRVGDHCGKLPDASSVEVEKPDHFFHQQTLFETNMLNSENKFDFDLLVKNHANKHGSITPGKVVLFVVGTSGAGKTHFVEVMKKHFPKNVTHVSRDEVIASVCVSVHERLTGKDYVQMYKIYEAGKTVSSFLRKKKLEKKDVENFEKAKQHLSTVQAEWNEYIKTIPEKNYPQIEVLDTNTKSSDAKSSDSKSQKIPNISELVRQTYIQEIMIGLKDNKFFLVLDTFMNCFPIAVEENAPDELYKHFRVHVHIQSYVERTGSSIASSLADQLKVSGQYGLDNPIHPDGFKTGNMKKMFASLSSEIGTEGPLPKSTFSSKFRPHLVAGVITRTEQDPSGQLGYKTVLDCLTRLICNYLPKPSDAHKIIKHEHGLTTESKTESKTELNVESKLDTETEPEPSDSADKSATFGVDPETKHFNVVQMYSHLLKRFKGDRSEIREFLRTLDGDLPGAHGFMHNAFIEKSYDSLTLEEQMQCCEKLSQLSERWTKSGVTKNTNESKSFFENSELREAYFNSIVIVKYFEQFGARFWQNAWAKEMRGTVLFVHPETTEVKTLSFKLPRGAEALTGMVKDNGLETQDVKSGMIKILDDEQQDTCVRLCTNKPIKMHLTAKGDGSLLVINCFTGNLLKVMLPIVELFGNNYVNIWAKQSLKLTNGKRLLIPSTQGTVMEGGFMTSYMVASMLVGSNIVSREEIESFKESNTPCEDAWTTYGEKFIERFLQFHFFDELTEAQTFCFEAICKDRIGMIGDHIHTELACSYDRDRLIFLGTTLCDRRFYIPHSMYELCIDKKIPFESPLWWTIEHASTVNAMIDDIDKLMRNKITKEQFLTLYNPSNFGFDSKNSKNVRDAVIDFEGWVAMKEANLPITDTDHILTSKTIGVPLTIYSKIKTFSYYISHKFHDKNVASLIELGKMCTAFPLATKLAKLCESGVITQRLRTVGDEIMKLLDFKNPDNKILEQLKREFKESFDHAKKLVDEGKSVKIPKNPFEGFDRRTFEVQCKIVLNFKGFDFGILLRPIYLKAFPEIVPNTPELESVFRKVTMHFEPWTSKYEENIKNLNVFSTSVRDLIVACLGADFF